MPDVELKTVHADEADLRLDRWFKRHYPALPFGRLAKLLRTGQVRVNGRRAAPGDRLEPGAEIRIPPLDAEAAAPKPRVHTPVRPEDAAALRAAILYRDDHILAINKWPGLAVQGGSGTHTHLDGMLDALKAGGERPRLVHRLDRDTSGVLLLARTQKAASHLTRAFRDGEVEKTYWALVLGVPAIKQGEVDMPLSKIKGPHGEQMGHSEQGQAAKTLYDTIEVAGQRLAWLALRPVTGRTHQLRVHMAGIGHPILGDRKYGGPDAMVEGFEKRLHLHARSLSFRTLDGKAREVKAPLPAHMQASWDFLELDQSREGFEDAQG